MGKSAGKPFFVQRRVSRTLPKKLSHGPAPAGRREYGLSPTCYHWFSDHRSVLLPQQHGTVIGKPMLTESFLGRGAGRTFFAEKRSSPHFLLFFPLLSLSLSSPQARVEGIAYGFSQQVIAHDGDENGAAWEDGEPPCDLYIIFSFGEHVAP